MRDLPVLPLVSPVQDFLHTLPIFTRHQRLVTALIGGTGIIEIPRVDPPSENLVERRHRNLTLTLTETEPLFVRLLSERLERVFSARVPRKQLRHNRPEHCIRHDDLFPVGAHPVHITQGRK